MQALVKDFGWPAELLRWIPMEDDGEPGMVYSVQGVWKTLDDEGCITARLEAGIQPANSGGGFFYPKLKLRALNGELTLIVGNKEFKGLDTDLPSIAARAAKHMVEIMHEMLKSHPERWLENTKPKVQTGSKMGFEPPKAG